MKKILILGGSGIIGKALINVMSKEFDVYATYLKNTMPLAENKSFKLDIRDCEAINGILNSVKPQIVISCIRGNFDDQLIMHMKVSEYLKSNGGKLYFFSTTNVFDKDLERPHYEDDVPCSCTDYGNFKIKCEKRITMMLHDNACILRIPAVWGKNSPRMNNLLDLLRNNKKIVMYPELFINVNTDTMIARQLFYIIKNDLKGIFHLASEGPINWEYFYAELIKNVSCSNANIEESSDEKGYFVLLSKRRDEFPEYLRQTGKSVIDCTTG